ncbi:MAG: hypothetical protein ACJ74Y_17980 [Bryobacteraceae bacterium]
MQASAALHHHRRAWEGVSRQFLRFFVFIDALSLAAPLVAVIWQLSLVRAFQLRASRLEPVVLALAIWTLYAADHVLDALRGMSSFWEPTRKTFYRLHWRTMATVASCTGLASLALAVCSLRRSTLLSGVAIGAFVFAYFLFVHMLPLRWRGLWPREAVVALGFSLGTFVPLMPSRAIPPLAGSVQAIVFFLLCWLNCCAVETWEWQRSGCPSEQRPHVSTRWNARHLAVLAIIVGTGALVAARWLGRGNEFGLGGFSSGIALYLLAQNQSLLPDSILGISADLALCVPALFLGLR